MASLDSNFQELRLRLKDSTSLRNTGGDPVYYLIFHPREMLQVKRLLRVWRTQLTHDDWQVETVSLARVIGDFFADHPLREIWQDGEAGASLAEVNETLRAALVDERVVENALLERLQPLEAQSHGLLLITDVEALHPYIRMGAVEQRLQGRVNVPVVVLYPGTRRGQSNLSFLGIYPEDGNYRSIHIGG